MNMVVNKLKEEECKLMEILIPKQTGWKLCSEFVGNTGKDSVI